MDFNTQCPPSLPITQLYLLFSSLAFVPQYHPLQSGIQLSFLLHCDLTLRATTFYLILLIFSSLSLIHYLFLIDPSSLQFLASLQDLKDPLL